MHDQMHLLSHAYFIPLSVFLRVKASVCSSVGCESWLANTLLPHAALGGCGNGFFMVAVGLVVIFVGLVVILRFAAFDF